MIFETFPVGPFQCNCMIVGCEETRTAVVIDPGEEADRILESLSRHQLTTAFLLHTHAHLDHIRELSSLADNLCYARRGTPLLVCRGDLGPCRTSPAPAGG